MSTALPELLQLIGQGQEDLSYQPLQQLEMIDLEQGQDFPLNESSVRPVRVLDKALQVSRWGMHAGVGGIGEGFSGGCWVIVRRRRDDCPTVTGS